MRLSFIVVRYLFGVVLCLAVTFAHSFAANATFSKDGRHLYFVGSSNFPSALGIVRGTLFDIDVGKQSASQIDLGPLINNHSIVAVCISNSGDLLVATDKDAWSCNIQKKSCTKICDAPEGVWFDNMAYDPKNGGILFRAGDGSGKNGAVFLKAGTSKPLPVLVRPVEYVQDLQGMTFSPTGELYFGTRGDLWRGIIAQDEVAKGHPEGETRSWHLAAERIAPLAKAYNAPGVRVEMAGVAVARTKLYVLLNRLRDSGHVDETVLRIQKPETVPGADAGVVENEAADSLHLSVKEIASVGVPADLVGWTLCASLDGKRVFYGYVTNHNEVFDIPSLVAAGKAYIIENDGKPRELKLKLPEQASPTASPTARPALQKHPFEKEPDYMKRLKQQVDEIIATPRPSQSP